MSTRRQEVQLSRREFIIMGVGVAGSLVIGLPAAASIGGDKERMIGFFVQINADGSVTIGSNQPEIGQGIRSKHNKQLSGHHNICGQ